MTIKIIADQNIPQVERAFGHIGEVQKLDGRQLTAEQLAGAEMLLVRSVTQVNEALLKDSRLRFIGSATIGTDHVDLNYLKQRGITFSNAPGCNAVSAAEYVVAAVLYFAQSRKISTKGLRVGIVGCGNVGSRVATRLESLGCELLIYDPPRQLRYQDRDYVSWERVQTADILTAHVPLTRSGDWPTYKMFNHEFFSALHDDALFINTSRGFAVDETALKEILTQGKSLQLILDVWQNEPRIDLELLAKTLLATPHIAGYSAEGKLRGLEMIYHAACDFLKLKPRWSLTDSLPPPATIYTPDVTDDDLNIIRSLVTEAYDIRRDDQALRAVCALDDQQRASGFDALRKNYPVRREFSFYQIAVPARREALANCLSRLGFNVSRTETG